MGYGYSRDGRGRGLWPGNGPFRDIPPWERPGWLYGPGSCWYLGYRTLPTPPSVSVPTTNAEMLQKQKEVLENQLTMIQEQLRQIEDRLRSLEKGE